MSNLSINGPNSSLSVRSGAPDKQLLQVKPATQLVTVSSTLPPVIHHEHDAVEEAPVDGQQYARNNAAWRVVTGVPGIPGPPGLTGPEGPEGPKGTQGIQGIQGIQGPQGVKGDQGNIGPQGVKGDQGNIGPQGIQGDTGIQGIQGVIGPVGPQGLKGDQGIQGVPGTPGIPDAPIDGKQYARKDAAWAEVVASSGAGRIFYLDPTDSSDISGYKKMLAAPSLDAESTLVAACTGTADFLLASFATDAGIPGAGVYPTGTAYRRIYAKVSSGTAKLHLQIYIRNAAGTETLARDEFSPDFIDQTATLQEWLASMAYAGTLLATDRLVTKLYAQRVAGGAGGVVTVTAYFEGTARVSHIQTTLPGGAASGAGSTALDALTPATANDANLVGFKPASGSGKAINITAGDAATSAGAALAGGAINIAGGAPGAAGSAGGAVSILSGASTTTGPSGTLTIQGGTTAAGGAAGLVKVQGANGASATAGPVTIAGGAAGAAGTSVGGLLTLSGGVNGAVAGSKGGSVAILVPDSLGAVGGSLSLTGGAAGNVSFGNGPVGGDITLLAGKGGGNTNSFAAGIGGAINLTAGAGGTPQSGTSTAGGGGAVTIRAGAGGGTVGNGGNVTLQPGAAAGTGVPGTIALNGVATLTDGTVAAPSLAFANEPGLGFYRPGASIINMAAAGASVFALNAVTAAATIVGVNPRTAGSSALSLVNQIYGSANYNALLIRQEADGTSNIYNTFGGTATKKQMSFIGANAYSFDNTLILETTVGALFFRKANGTSANIYGTNATGLPRWLLALGSSASELGGNIGSDFVLQRYDDAGASLGSPLSITRSTGTINFGVGIVNLNGGKLAFPTPQQASSDPNTLDDYAEGSYNLTNAAVQPGVAGAFFTKIGRLVFISAQLTFPNTASGSAVQFNGLPYSALAGCGLAIGYCSAISPAGTPFSIMTSGSSLNVYAGGAFATFAQLSNSSLYFAGCYYTN